MINVTKTYLPPFEEYTEILKRAWDKAWITNHGELAQELESKLKDYLGVDHLLYCSNGTIVLQMALKALNITKEVITTPFSYVATTNAILWEGCKPVFVDVEPNTFCIDPDLIERAITEDTQAILATHVYGYPCNIDRIEKIAHQYKLKVIYDGAHAFGVKYQGKSLLDFGDVATCSFHATKLFHNVEGGCIIVKDKALLDQLVLYRSFGHLGDTYFSMGINAKNSEFHAAMGIAVFPYLESILKRRAELSLLYESRLRNDRVARPTSIQTDLQYNHAYFPVLFRTEDDLLKVQSALLANQINTRRYFYPSLNTLPFLPAHQPCQVSEDVSKRVLCLPLYPQLTDEEVNRIVGLVNQSL